jgi:hypothetical protein
MTTITRKDGQQFVVQAYREVLDKRKRSLLAQEIRLLAEQQGSYVCLRKLADDRLEATFSQDSGHLLGEAIWEHFSRPDNLLYCEAIPGSKQLLLVVVQQGHVYLDMRVPVQQLRVALLPLISKQCDYQVVIAGKVPLSDLPKELMTSFKQLDKPVFATLSLPKSAQLKPLALALRSERLTRRVSPLLLSVLALIVIIAGWLFMSAPSTVAVVAPVAPAPMTMLAYNHALLTPAPEAQLEELRHAVTQLYGIPGWQLSHLQFDGQHYHIKVISDGADMEMLEAWAKESRYQLQLTSNGPVLSQRTATVARLAPEKMQPLQPLLTMLIDEIDQLLQAKSVSLGQIQTHGDARTTLLTIHVNQISPEILDLVGRELDNLPLSLKAVNININSGLLSGNIQLSVWGS